MTEEAYYVGIETAAHLLSELKAWKPEGLTLRHTRAVQTVLKLS